MKRITSLLLTLVLALTLVGCGSASQNASADSVAQDYGSYWNMNGSDTYETSESQRDDMLVEEADSAAGGAQNTKPVKMIYTGYMEMQTLDFDKASSDMDALVKELGGYFQQSSVSNGSDGYRRASYTVRVPAAQFEPFFRQAGQLCHVTYKNASADDVSESYYDTEARLETARIKLERLQTLLAKATSMEDIITIESAISDTEQAIDSLSGELRHYDSLVGYSTVTLSLEEVYRLSDTEAPATGFVQRMGTALTSGWKGFITGVQGILIALAYGWVWLVLLAAVACLVILWVRRVKKRKRDQRTADMRKNAAPERKEDGK